MEEPKIIHIQFAPDESYFLELVMKHCENKSLSVEEYIKGIIKKDLAWGQLARRKKAT